MTGTVLTPRQPDVSPGRHGFGQLLRAEWVKFRTVRGWVIAMVVAALVTVFLGIFAAGNLNIGCQHGPNGPVLTGRACTPVFPIGPDGEAVVDSYYLAHQTLTGNGSMTARVTSLTGLHGGGKAKAAGPNPLAGMTRGLVPWAKAGLIITDSARPG